MDWDLEDDDRPWENSYDYDEDYDEDDDIDEYDGWYAPVNESGPPPSLPVVEPDDQNENALQGVICMVHGHQGLTQANYFEQLSNADDEWTCPICGENAIWDEDRSFGN